VEALGFPGPDLDVEVILMARALWRELGLTDVRLEINSLGQPAERLAHRAALIAYFEAHADQLDEDARRRLHSNPLRILDTKNPAMQALVEAAPKLIDHLGEASLAHLEGVKAALTAVGQPFTINPRLVRGMDYYNLTVFEWVTDRLGSQGTVCAGGRYDGLIEQIGGKSAPAVGWGMGIERVLALLEDGGVAVPATVPDVYAVVPDAAALPQVIAALELLRTLGVTVQMHAGGKDGQGSFKSQFKKADASGARHALIFGADELAQGMVTVKPLRDATAAQVQRPLAELASWGPGLRAPGAEA
jgi:histidyl-tRNA synthetase